MTAKRGDVVTHRDLQLGDCVSLMFPDGGWDNAKVTRVSDTLITLMRPWMDSSDGYPRVGFEVFDVWRDSDKTVRLISRTKGEESC